MRYIVLAFILAATLPRAEAATPYGPNTHPDSPTGASETTGSPEKGNTGLSGTVTDSANVVVAGATVTIRSSAGESKTAVTDADGQFQIDGLSAGKYEISVTKDGFQEYKVSGWSVVEGVRNILLEVILSREILANIEGMVTDISGAVVAGSTVTIRGADGVSKAVVTDAQGTFLIAGLSPGKYQVLATAKGFGDFRTSGLRVKMGDRDIPVAIILSAASSPTPSSATADIVSPAPSAPAAPPGPGASSQPPALPAAPESPSPSSAPAPQTTVAPTPEQTPAAAPVADSAQKPAAPPEAAGQEKTPAPTSVEAPPGSTGVGGTVSDTTGAVIPGATVTVRSASGEIKSVATDAEGKFAVIGLTPGKYDVSVTAQGFAESKLPGFTVVSGSVGSLNIQLQLVVATTQVNVQAQKLEQVETESAEISGTITRQEVVELGLNGRNFTQLIALAPGVSNQTSQDEAKVGVAGSAKFSVNGGRVEYNTFEVDGSDVLNTDIAASHGHTTLSVYPSLDAIQEMKVLTSNYGAQFGRTASGTVQVMTKSGGEKFHGDAYEFLRNEAFNSRNFFDPPGRAPLYRRNDFGGTIGGPLYLPHLYNQTKDKTFFFISEEFRRERSPFDVRQGVPSDAERGYNASTNTYGSIGDFSDVCPLYTAGYEFNLESHPDCPSYGNSNFPRESYQNNQIYIAPAATAILQTGLIPRANETAGCNSSADSCYVGTVSPPTSWREELVRLDHNLSPSTKISLHGVHDHWDTTTPVPQWGNEVNTFPTVLNDFQGPGLSAIVNATSVISPSMVNSASLGFTWQHITLSDLPGSGVTLSPAGLDALQSPMGDLFNNGLGGKIPGVVIAGNNEAYGGTGFNVDTSYMPWSHLLEKATVRDDLSRAIGKHTLQAGVQFVHAQRNEQSAANGANTGDIQGLMTFTNTANVSTTGNAFADFLFNGDSYLSAPSPVEDGLIRYYQQDDAQAANKVSYWDVEPYAQDDWRVTHHLTVNLGMRFSLFGNWKPVKQTLYNWLASDYNPQVWSNAGYSINYSQGYICTFSNACPNLSTPAPLPLNVANLDPTVTNGLVECGANHIPASCQSSHIVNPAPRAGFAWDPSGNGRTSIRGGYGMFFEHGTGSEANAGSLMGNPPQVLSMTEGYPTNYQQIGQPPHSPAGTLAMYPLNMISIPTKTQWPYVQQWSFGVQRELARDTIATVSYVGSKGTHLATTMQINQLPPVSNANNPFLPGQPITRDLCDANGLLLGSPFDPAGYFYVNNTNLYYANNPSAVLGLEAACDGTPGSNGHQPVSYDLNVLRPYQGIGEITSIQNVGKSSYNSLQVTLRHHRGPIDLGVSYTYGHSIDTASDRYESTFVDSFDLEANRASSDFDERHLLNVSYLYKLPLVDWAKKVNEFLGGEEGAANGPPSVANNMFKNWVLSGITVYQSGTPFSIINGTSTSGIGALDNAGLALGFGADSYPDIAPRGTTCTDENLLGASGTFGPIVGNRCRFVAPRGLTQGDAGRNSLFNPARTNFDWALLRDFKVWGERTLQFRAEAFNIFNTTQFRIFDPVRGNTASNTISCYGDWDSLYQVGASFSAGAPNCTAGNAFLRPVDAHRSRTIQLGVKFNF